MTVKMILAVDRGGAIGWKDGRLPWSIRSDMKRFKALTTGHSIVMGCNTYLTLPPAGLPNRTNYVITRTKPFEEVTKNCPNLRFFRDKGPDGTYENSFATFVQVHQACLGCTPPDLWVIGGAQIYRQAIDLKLVDEIYMTLVDDVSGGDVLAPADIQDWKLFVIRQRELGVNWEVVELTPHSAEGEPNTTYLTLKKVT